MDRFASCAKSVVSIQEQTCHRQACVQLKKRWQQLSQSCNSEQNNLPNQEQLIGQISRLKRKLSITQKSKILLYDQLSIIKEQLEITKNKVKNSKQTKNVHEQLAASQISTQEEKTNRIVLKQRQQQIEILICTIREMKRELQSYKNKNIQLIDQINSKKSILAKMQESTNSQLNFYRSQIKELQENLEQKNKELQNRQKWFIKTLEKEREECNKMKKNMQIKLIQKQQELQELFDKQKKLWQNIYNLQQKIKLNQQQCINQKQENNWLKKVIEQAKIEYIHNQLVKLQQKDKKNKENQDRKRRGNIAQLAKHLKSHANMLTALPSAKTQRISNNCSISCIPPFRLTPQDLNLSQFESSLDRSQLNQC